MFVVVTYFFRKAETTDKEDLFELYCLVMRPYVSEIWDWDQQWQQDDFDRHYDPEKITSVYDERDLAAYCQIEDRGDALFVRMLAVHPDHQGKGIGTKLLENVISLGEAQSKSIRLEVFKFNDRAKRFYEGHGFEFENETNHSICMVLVTSGFGR